MGCRTGPPARSGPARPRLVRRGRADVPAGDGGLDLSPSTASVTLAPTTGADIREVFCERVNFHATADLAKAATERDSDPAACSLGEACALG